MSSAPLLLAIDAYTAPGGLYPVGGAPPAIITSLRSIESRDGGHPLAPVILCDADGAARARGALLVTDDQDGVAIVLPPGIGPDGLRAVVAAWAWRLGEACELRLVAAGAPADSGDIITPQPVCDGPAFHPSQLGGCLVPSEWLMLAIRTGDLL